jgi:hypothetical protein
MSHPELAHSFPILEDIMLLSMDQVLIYNVVTVPVTVQAAQISSHLNYPGYRQSGRADGLAFPARIP